MFEVRALIKKNLHRYPDFDYLNITINKAIRNLGEHNDVVIDCSKSLIEATCKNIIVALSDSETHVSADRYKLVRAFDKAISEIAIYDDFLDVSVVEEMVKVVKAIGNVRNKRGDVSHGHVSPKVEISNEFYAKFVMHSAARISEYLLASFYEIDLSSLIKINYADNPDFNEYIDDIFKLSLEKKFDYVDVIYSAALYEQKYTEYYDRLLEYLAGKEEAS